MRNGVPTPVSEVPRLDAAAWHARVVEACRAGARIAALFAAGDAVYAILAVDAESRLDALATPRAPELPSLTPELPQAQAFERELHELFGITPVGHPWLKPLRRHDGSHPFFRVDGPGIHEVAVGPVHAGVIEPGHFRFQCHGEVVHTLEIHLGYQHRGAEELFLRSPPARRMVIAESIAGDTAVGHGLAYVANIEKLAGVRVPLAGKILRGIALELERLANHVGDLGALCGDVGYQPGLATFGRLRGEFLNLLMELSGNRFGRGLLKPGGVRFSWTDAQRQDALARLARAERDLRAIAEMTFGAPSVLSRFEEAGRLTAEVAEELGLVGPVARACGLRRDVRSDQPAGIYRFAHIPVAVADTGDVMARALVRWVEVQRSLTFVKEQIGELPGGAIAAEAPPPGRDLLVCSLVEGWRGEIAHVALTGADGALAAYKIVDPSFHNWFGLAMALRGNQISDFPLCNKSFNLSYAGHDL